MPAERIKEYLESEGIAFESIVHQRTYTAQQTAAVSHVKGQELAKAVMLEADERCIMVVLPASKRVRLELAGEVTGAASLRLADEHEFSRLFPGCELGAMPPLGKLFGVEMWVDESLKSFDAIAFPAGTHTEILKIPLNEFVRLESPNFANLSA